MENKPGFIAIMPADVRYDRRLNGNEKVLYAEITALANSSGYCWATNDYFASLFESDRKPRKGQENKTALSTVSRWISSLRKKKYLKAVFVYKKNGARNRYLFPHIVPSFQDIEDGKNYSYKEFDSLNSNFAIETPSIAKLQRGVSKIAIDPHSKIATENINNINSINTNNNIYRGTESSGTGGSTPDEGTTSETNQEKKIPFKGILDYFNKKTGRSFLTFDSKTIMYIRDWWEKGFRVTDFMYVVDVMYEHWKDDRKFSNALTPTVLFCEKFQNWRNWKKTDALKSKDENPGQGWEDFAKD